MSTSAVSQALTALIPSLPASNKPFPPVLVSQCNSLIALSRQRAANLKAEEEIARAHACSEIACRRLRAQLRLPAIRDGAGAPCKPRVYSKLIGFLEGVLADAPVGSLTPRGTKRDATGSVKESGGSARRQTTTTPRGGDETPSKKRTTNREPGTKFAGKIKSSNPHGQDHAVGDDKVPTFVMPLIRNLCKNLSTPQMIPHIYTGTCVVLELSQLWPPADDDDDSSAPLDPNLETDIQTLVIALYLIVLTKMRKGKMTMKVYDAVSTEGLKLLKMDEDPGLDSDSDTREKVEAWVDRVNDEGWGAGRDWWESVPEDVLVLKSKVGRIVEEADEDGDGNEDQDEEVEEEDRAVANTRGRLAKAGKAVEDDPDGVLLPGLGTMLHDSIDWTSEDRRLDYKAWKVGMLRNMNVMEKSGGRKGKAISAS